MEGMQKRRQKRISTRQYGCGPVLVERIELGQPSLTLSVKISQGCEDQSQMRTVGGISRAAYPSLAKSPLTDSFTTTHLLDHQ